MPIYEYRCTVCGHAWSEQGSIAEHRRQPPCPRCRSTATEQVFSDFFAKTVRKS